MSNINDINGVEKKPGVTDKLVTKIMLGTMCCTPAYDTYFVLGLKKTGFEYTNFDKQSIIDILSFCRDHETELIKNQKIICKETIKYPMMKLIDMYFWQKGKLESEDENKKIKNP